MVITVTANAAIDRTAHVGRLGARAEQRSNEPAQEQAGGKGVNVARILRALNVPVCCIVVVGGGTGRWILQDLERSAIPFVAVQSPGESRICTQLVEARGARVRQSSEGGVHANEAVAASLLRAVSDRLAHASWIALCGSLADGLPIDIVERLVAVSRQHGVASAIDTSGAALTAAWRAAPDLLRVNRDEAAAANPAFVRNLETDARPPDGPLIGVISDGASPFRAWHDDGRSWYVTPPCVHLSNPVGCGDAMMAGLIARLRAGAPVASALRFATALAAADAESPLAGRSDLSRAKDLMSTVKVELNPRTLQYRPGSAS